MKSPCKVVRTITINVDRAELFRFWRALETLPKFAPHLDAVRVLDNRTSHWVAKAPAGKTIEWEAEIVAEQPNELLAWRSRPGSQLENAGSVRFRPAPGRRGTEVTVHLEYAPPAGVVGQTIARLFGHEPEQQLNEDLRRFKSLMETGEIPTAMGALLNGKLSGCH
jgi:uncharacterized membrane protein